jgi:anti-anti-sigma regulatory factor
VTRRWIGQQTVSTAAAVPVSAVCRAYRAVAVSENSYPVRWAGRRAVVVLPDHLGLPNAGQVSEALLLVINRGADALIVDMTATISCDYTGAEALLRARQRAVASGTELRLAVTHRIVRRALSLSGLGARPRATTG